MAGHTTAPESNGALSERSESKGALVPRTRQRQESAPAPKQITNLDRACRRCHRRLTVVYVYILRCADDSLYVGQTHDLDARLTKHNNGRAPAFTASRRPVGVTLTALFFAMLLAQLSQCPEPVAADPEILGARLLRLLLKRVQDVDRVRKE
jgi:hypothetical protein